VLNTGQVDIFQNVSKDKNTHIITKDTSPGSKNRSKAQKDKGKGNVVPLQAMKVHGKSRGIAPSQ